MSDKSPELQILIRNIFEVVKKLEELYPGRHFTPDGHMVGSLGEVVAAERYGLKLFEASYPIHDAKTSDGTLVQIKTTQGKTVGLRECPEQLIVLHLDHDGCFKEVYNGPGELAWNAAGKLQSNGQRFISLNKLRKLMELSEPEDRIGWKAWD